MVELVFFFPLAGESKNHIKGQGKHEHPHLNNQLPSPQKNESRIAPSLIFSTSIQTPPSLCLFADFFFKTSVPHDNTFFTTGGRFGEINPVGIQFYNKLIDALLLKGNLAVFC